MERCNTNYLQTIFWISIYQSYLIRLYIWDEFIGDSLRFVKTLATGDYKWKNSESDFYEIDTSA